MNQWKKYDRKHRTPKPTKDQLEALKYFADPDERCRKTPCILLGETETLSLMETFNYDLTLFAKAANKLGWSMVNAAGLTIYLATTVVVKNNA